MNFEKPDQTINIESENEISDKAEEILQDWESLRADFGKMKALLEDVPASFLPFFIGRDMESLSFSVPIEQFMESLRNFSKGKEVDFASADIFIRDFGRLISELNEALNKTEIFTPTKHWLVQETHEKMSAGKLIEKIPDTKEVFDHMITTYRKITNNISNIRKSYRLLK